MTTRQMWYHEISDDNFTLTTCDCIQCRKMANEQSIVSNSFFFMANLLESKISSTTWVSHHILLLHPKKRIKSRINSENLYQLKLFSPLEITTRHLLSKLRMYLDQNSWGLEELIVQWRFRPLHGN